MLFHIELLSIRQTIDHANIDIQHNRAKNIHIKFLTRIIVFGKTVFISNYKSKMLRNLKKMIKNNI